MNQTLPQIPAGLFAMAPEAIFEFFTSKEKFPEGPATGIRILSFYRSYAGRREMPSRLKRLERAQKMLTLRVEQMVKESKQAA